MCGNRIFVSAVIREKESTITKRYSDNAMLKIN
jgi:hypothetical protein